VVAGANGHTAAQGAAPVRARVPAGRLARIANAHVVRVDGTDRLEIGAHDDTFRHFGRGASIQGGHIAIILARTLRVGAYIEMAAHPLRAQTILRAFFSLAGAYGIRPGYLPESAHSRYSSRSGDLGARPRFEMGFKRQRLRQSMAQRTHGERITGIG